MHRRTALRAGVAALAGTAVLGRAGAADDEPYAPLGSVAVEGTREVVVGDGGRTAYLATTDGYAVVDVAEPERPTVVAERRDLLADEDDGPLSGVWDVAVSGDRLLVVAPAHGGHDLRGALLVDVSDPGSPEQVAFHRTDYPIHNADLDGTTAYLAANGGGRHAVDVVEFEGGPERVGSWALTDVDEGWADVPGALANVHDVTVADGVAACAHWDAGTWLLDVSDPTAPTGLGRAGGRDAADLAAVPDDEVGLTATTPPGNDHHALVDGDLLAVGRESWAATVDGEVVGGPSGVDLWDVSDPTDPVRRATVAPPPTPDPTRDGVWTTAHNLDLRDGRLYVAWYQGGVARYDVGDPADPVREAWWRAPDRTRFWAAVLARPGEAFVASSTGVGDGDAGLFAFPDRPGEQGDPPALTATAAPTRTAVRSGTERAGTSTTAGTETSASERTGTSATAGSGSVTGTGATGVRAPGFGVVGALAAVAVGAWCGGRRDGAGGERSE